MKSKDKILKKFPDAFARNENGYTIIRRINEDTAICLSHSQPRESWAWAQAGRLLKVG